MNEASVTSPQRRRRWWRYAGEALLLVLLFIGVHSWQIRDLPAGRAPPLEGMLLNGDPITPPPWVASRCWCIFGPRGARYASWSKHP